MPWACAHNSRTPRQPGNAASAECAEPPTNATEPSRSASYALLTGKMSSTVTSRPSAAKNPSSLAAMTREIRVRDQIRDGDPHGGRLYTGTTNLSYNLTILVLEAGCAWRTRRSRWSRSRHASAASSAASISRQPVSQAQIDEIRAALVEHQVMFFRKQPIDIDTHKAFGRRFGELQPPLGDARGSSSIPRCARSMPTRNRSTSRARSGTPTSPAIAIPPMGSILHIHTLPPLGGDTICSRACTPPTTRSRDRMKKYLEGLTATHDGGHRLRRFNPNGKFPISSHPVIARHPETKRPAAST